MSDLPPHPAKFSDHILAAIAQIVDDEAFFPGDRELPLTLLDPFAGTGKIHQLDSSHKTGFDRRIRTFGIEIEPEWADYHPQTYVGNALDLPFGNASMDLVATSCTYGNRMADHHVAKDSSKRMTYTHQLGRQLDDDNSGKMHWGPKYWEFHQKAWAEMHRVLVPGGLFILNVKDFLRTKKGVQEYVGVAQWHIDLLLDMGYSVEVDQIIPVKGMGFGANGKSRVDHERVIAFRKKK